jgi:hypothetical protein
MARFRGSTTQQGVQPQADNRQGVESESHHWTPEQIQRWQQQQAQQQQYHPPQAAPPFQNGQPVDHGAPAGGWPEPQYGYGTGYGDPAQAVPQGQPPQFGSAQPLGQDWGQHHRAAPPESNHPAWANAPGADPRQALLDRLGPAAHDEPARFDEPAADQSRHAAQSPYGQLTHAGHDPRYRDTLHDGQAWDTGGYPAHAGVPGGHGYDPQLAGGYDAADQRWASQNGHPVPPFAGQHGHGGYADQGFDQGPAGQHYGYDPHQQGHGHHDPQDGGFDQHVPEEVEERSRGPRALVVAGALVGAILLGGGLAFVYKKVSNTADSGSTPVVKAEKAPAKAKPATPGGKEVAHTDKRFLNSLSTNPPAAEKSASPAAGATTESDGGPRKVTTMVVGRDGSLSSEPPVAPAPPPASSGVPGMVIDGGPRPLLRGASPAETASVPAPPPVSQPSRSAEIPFPKARPEPPSAPPVEAEPRAEAPASKAPPRRKAVVRDDAAAPATTASAPATRASNGFVAVLSSRKSREEAFGMFPDLQVKYADTLQGMTPDVREVDLTAQGKGVVYRLIVGPPGSKEAAIGTCNKLKAQGYTGCWATPY